MTALVSCCLSAAGLRFLGHPVPPGASAPLTIGLPRRRRRGPERVFHVPHASDPAGSGALCTPGAAVPARPVVLPAAACRISTASPCRPGLRPAPGRIIDEASASFAPGRAGPGNARQGGDRPGHYLDYVPGISQPPSTYSLTTCDLTSQEPDELRAEHHVTKPPRQL
jgi:hypothetical protein